MNSHDEVPLGPAWETMAVNVPMPNTAEAKRILDALGRERWELVSVVYCQPLDGVTGVAFLKRVLHAA